MMGELPSGVFRHMLDYQFPNELCIRYSDHSGQIDHEQNTHFPAIDKLSYYNYLSL